MVDFDVLVIAVVVDEDGGRMWRKIKMGGSGRGRGGLGRGLLGVQAPVRSGPVMYTERRTKTRETHKRHTRETQKTQERHGLFMILNLSN